MSPSVEQGWFEYDYEGQRGIGPAPGGTLQFRDKKGVPMHEETFNLSIRKFLKIVGINSQREIEQAVRKALEAGSIKGDETFPASVTLTLPELDLSFKIDGEIRLQ
jgi:hypothetical protein